MYDYIVIFHKTPKNNDLIKPQARMLPINLLKHENPNKSILELLIL
jgi:hypothetical protein